MIHLCIKHLCYAKVLIKVARTCYVGVTLATQQLDIPFNKFLHGKKKEKELKGETYNLVPVCIVFLDFQFNNLKRRFINSKAYSRILFRSI